MAELNQWEPGDPPSRCRGEAFVRKAPDHPATGRLTMDLYADQIANVQRIAAEHVRRCGAETADLQQSFLFMGDLFVGVRFTAGRVEARWLFGARLVDLLREGAVVAKVPLEAPLEERRAA